MAIARARRREGGPNYWPGFVDAMATLLLVIIFLLSMFMLTQFFLSQEIAGRDTVLNRLNSQIAELTELLALERAGKKSVEETLAALQDSLADTTAERERLQSLLNSQAADASQAVDRTAALTTQLDEEKRVSASALAKVELLNQQIAALRRQLAAIETALEASETRDKEAQVKIADLGRRLNVALAQKVQQLARYRSDFFGRLREILSQRADIQVVGDRFVFQSEVLFDSGSAEINPAGRQELEKLGVALRELEQEIPPDIAWVLRVDGHTDARPIQSARFPSNWELSSARAISVVRFLMDKGISPTHLVAAGFGEHQPLDPGTDEAALRRNRRIELKLTER